MQTRIKNTLIRLDRRFPVLRDLLRKSRFIRKLLRKTRLVHPRVLRTHEGFLCIPPIYGLPKFAKFTTGMPTRGVTLLIGVTHDHPSLHQLELKAVVADERGDALFTYKPGLFTRTPVTAPWAISALLPECVYWYERYLGDLPAGAHELRARFHSSASLPGRDDLPPGFRFYCLVINRVESDESPRLVDLRHCAPYTLSAVEEGT